MKKILIAFAAVVAVTLVGVLIRQEFFYHPTTTLNEPLAEAVSADLPGWTSEDLPLANSPEMQERTEEILNFEEAIYRVYKQGDREIGVYVAYWKPKQMPVRMVEAHTPDICWVKNGWTRREMEPGVPLAVGETELFPAEYRAYNTQDGGALTYVYYWHTVGDTLYVNRSTKLGTWDRLDPIKTIFHYGLDQMQEQFFIRISSNKPFGDIFEVDPGMRELMQELADLTLAVPPPPPADQPSAT
jgi:hypothetical protein